MTTVTLASSGGVELALPGDWRLAETGPDAAAFGSSDPDGPVLVLREAPVRLTVEAWWDAARSAPGAVLVDVDERGDGFVARHAWLDGDRSTTTWTRVVGAPGRSLVAAVSVPTAVLPQRHDDLLALLDGVAVTGVPSGSLADG